MKKGRETVKILLVVQNPDEAAFIKGILSGTTLGEIEWVHVDRLNKAVNQLSGDRFDAILLDLSVPDAEGPESVVQIQAREKNVPIILLIDSDEQAAAIQALRKGVQDFLLKKEINGERLTHAVLCAIERHNFTQKLIHTNQRVLGQQASLAEEDRFNLLLKLAGTTAHELKQPLTALLGNIELMKLSGNNPAEWKGHITEIEHAGKRIDSIVSKMQQIRYEDANSPPKEPLIVRFEQKKNILSIEDTDSDFESIETCLRDETFLGLSRVLTCSAALQRLEEDRFDLILLDYLLPDGNALDFMKTMHLKGFEIPVVFVTGQGDEMIAAKAIQAGAYDYLTKGKINKTSLLKAITYAMEKARLLKEISQIQKRIVEMSIQDELTGLYNRRYMEEMLEIEFSRARMYHTDLSCLIMDLDHFKEVNDSFGHAFGDLVLKEFAETLKNSTRNSDWRFRYGGEEFMLLVPGTDIHGARRMAEKIRRMCEKKVYANKSHSAKVTVSIGIASKNHHQPDRPEDLMGYADKALYGAKNSGRNCIRVFNE